MSVEIRGTTILAVLDSNGVAMAGDGQVTMGQNVVMKHTARKVRRIYNEKILVGFAGATADAFTLFERFEGKLEQYKGNLLRASVELAKEWRTDKYLRKLEALMIASDGASLLIITGTGDVIEPDDGLAAIGSGGSFALSAARALKRHTEYSAMDIAEKAMNIAGEICVYTNNNLVIEEIQKNAS